MSDLITSKREALEGAEEQLNSAVDNGCSREVVAYLAAVVSDAEREYYDACERYGR